MSDPVELLEHDAAVRSALESLDRPVGFAEAPAGALAGVQNETGPDYLILYPLDDRRRGDLLNPYEDVELVYQVTVVAALPDGARYLVPQIEAALKAVTFPGRHVVKFTPEGAAGARRDDDVDPPVFYATPRYRYWTTPAS